MDTEFLLGEETWEDLKECKPEAAMTIDDPMNLLRILNSKSKYGRPLTTTDVGYNMCYNAKE